MGLGVFVISVIQLPRTLFTLISKGRAEKTLKAVAAFAENRTSPAQTSGMGRPHRRKHTNDERTQNADQIKTESTFPVTLRKSVFNYRCSCVVSCGTRVVSVCALGTSLCRHDVTYDCQMLRERRLKRWAGGIEEANNRNVRAKRDSRRPGREGNVTASAISFQAFPFGALTITNSSTLPREEITADTTNPDETNV